MARYIYADKAHEGIEAIQKSFESNDDKIWNKNKPYYKGLAMARGVIDETPTADVAPRAEVIEEYRKKVYAKMEKYTVFGREYIQRIMREVEKEYTEARNDRPQIHGR